MAIKFHYSPLPPLVKVGPSEIDGQGILAKEFIPANTNIGICHVDVSMLKYGPVQLQYDSMFGKRPMSSLEDFPRGVFHNELIRTPLGGFLNHSPNPNCMILPDKLFWNLWTTEDIYIDDELCVDYNMYRCGFKEEGTDTYKEPTDE